MNDLISREALYESFYKRYLDYSQKSGFANLEGKVEIGIGWKSLAVVVKQLADEVKTAPAVDAVVHAKLSGDSEIHKVIEEKFKDCVPAWVWAEVEKQPTKDFVEVVRCKDCLWYKAENGCPLKESGYFKNGKMLPRENDFCSYGERKE